jgi:PhnB protein
MSQINAYLVFAGNCRETMEFYKECIGGELSLLTVGESPAAADMGPMPGHLILHASLTKNELMLLGSDMGMGEMIEGNTISLSLTCDSPEELNDCFNKLAAGGNVTHPVHDFFAGKLGTLTDRFGKNWMLYYDNTAK